MCRFALGHIHVQKASDGNENRPMQISLSFPPRSSDKERNKGKTICVNICYELAVDSMNGSKIEHSFDLS